MHGVESPSVSPVLSPSPSKHSVPSLYLDARGSTSGSRLRSGTQRYPMLMPSPRPGSFRTLPATYEASKVEVLGRVTTGTHAVNMRIDTACDSDRIVKELSELASEGNIAATTWLDIVDTLNSMSMLTYMRRPMLGYIQNDLLPVVWSLPDTMEIFYNVRVLVITRIFVLLSDILFKTLLNMLLEITSCQSFWQEFEQRPFRLRTVLALRKYTKYRNWVSLRETLQNLDRMAMTYYNHLGRLKELLLLFEEDFSLDEAAELARCCFEHINYIIYQESLDIATDDLLDDENTIKVFIPIMDSITTFESDFRKTVYPFTAVPRYVKYWPELCLTFVGVAGVAAVVTFRRDDFLTTVRRVTSSWEEFFSQHVTRPLAALVDEILFDHSLIVADVDAMNDAKASLGRMLRQYVQDLNPKIDPLSLAKIENSLDVSILSKQYEIELKKPITNLVSGDLIRMLLIQMQFLKKELLVVMTALDELIRENQFNLEVMATVPAFVLVFSIYQLGRYTFNAIRGSKRSKWYIFREVRMLLRDIEQLLNWNSLDQKTLRGIPLGRLVLILHQLESTLLLNSDYFDRHERRRLGEDVSELMSDDLTILQKMNTIHRMYRTYTFLQTSTRNLSTLIHVVK